MVACGLGPEIAGKLLREPPSPRIFDGSPLPSGPVHHSGSHRAAKPRSGWAQVPAPLRIPALRSGTLTCQPSVHLALRAAPLPSWLLAVPMAPPD